MNAKQSIDIILKYFPDLSGRQKHQLSMLQNLYQDWNSKINVISRKDIDTLYLHHVLHSMGIAKYIKFKPETKILDVGTGGGFPGIPLAILFPDSHFTLIDSIGKKIKVAQDVTKQIGLTNINLSHENVKEEKGKYQFIVSRAVMPASELVKLCRKNISKEQNNPLPNGIICLKGGDLKDENLTQFHVHEVIELKTYFEEDFFETKKVVYIQIKPLH